MGSKEEERLRTFTQPAVKEAAIEWLDANGWTIIHDPQIVARLFSADGPHPRSRDANTRTAASTNLTAFDSTVCGGRYLTHADHARAN
jgi:hypothetical protein